MNRFGIKEFLISVLWLIVPNEAFSEICKGDTRGSYNDVSAFRYVLSIPLSPIPGLPYIIQNRYDSSSFYPYYCNGAFYGSIVGVGAGISYAISTEEDLTIVPFTAFIGAAVGGVVIGTVGQFIDVVFSPIFSGKLSLTSLDFEVDKLNGSSQFNIAKLSFQF
jgi:hypothetical protein